MMGELEVGAQCPTFFCGCETLNSPYGENDKIMMVDAKIYVLILFIIIIIIGSIKMGIDWFLLKDFYPLKEKSPILCIMLIVSICGQILLYPIMYIVQYFTNSLMFNENKLKFRALNVSLEFSIFAIYLLRCLRISYAHDTHSSRSKHFSFKIFKNQYVLGIFVGLLSLIKMGIVWLDSRRSSNQDDGTIIHDFSISVEWQVPLVNLQKDHYYDQIYFIGRSILTMFFWHCVMVYCLWRHRSINGRYSMRREILLIIIIDLISAMTTIILLGTAVNQYDPNQQLSNILFAYCQDVDLSYPITQIIKIINLLLILTVSIILPLMKTNVYHVLLPTGRHYGFIKTMRDFLMEEEFRRVFTKYLQHLDKQHDNHTNTTLLQFWKKMIVIKINRKEGEMQKLSSLKNLINDVQDILFVDQSQLIINLKDSIIGLEESLQNSQSINEKVDELQKMALERLDRIYVKSYAQTQSYHYLKHITEDYKKINVNLVLLNLALIVDSENQFSS